MQGWIYSSYFMPFENMQSDINVADEMRPSESSSPFSRLLLLYLNLATEKDVNPN